MGVLKDFLVLWLELAFKGKSKWDQFVKAALWITTVIFFIPAAILDEPANLGIGALIGIVAIACILVSTFVLAWNMLPKLRFVKEDMRSGNWKGIIVENTSKLMCIKKPVVYWDNSTKPIEKMPIPLHQVHDDIANPQRPHIRPGGRAVFDLIEINQSTHEWEVISERGNITIDWSNYEVTLVASSESGSPVPQRIRITPVDSSHLSIELLD